MLRQAGEMLPMEKKLQEQLEVIEVFCLTKEWEDGTARRSKWWKVEVPSRFKDHVISVAGLTVWSICSRTRRSQGCPQSTNWKIPTWGRWNRSWIHNGELAAPNPTQSGPAKMARSSIVFTPCRIIQQDRTWLDQMRVVQWYQLQEYECFLKLALGK